MASYERPHTGRALFQIGNTLGPYVLLWYLMYLSLSVSWWLTVPLAVLAGALLVRLFIIFHDCGHRSFFWSPLANDVTGFVVGILALTPYHHWRWTHARHHGTTGDLDRRGIGDVWTMTVREYLESSVWKRFSYRLSRNPVVLFVLAPIAYLGVRQRFATRGADLRERRSVWWTNLAVLAMAVGSSWVFGIWSYLLIQLIVIGVAGAAGVWLFYVQHQFEDAYWERGEDWDYTAAALQGSSYYKLPAVLRWLSGNIGYHHIHHLSSKIPNYNLKRCHDAHEVLQPAKPLTLLGSLRTLTLRLWDEKLRKLVSFAGASKKVCRAAALASRRSAAQAR